jgi:hypothetical protein
MRSMPSSHLPPASTVLLINIFPRVSMAMRESRRRPTRPGRAARQVIPLVVVALLMAVTIAIIIGRNGDEESDAPLLTDVVRGKYEHVVLEQGEVESSNNLDIRCEVKNRTGGDTPSTTILDVIAEGTAVKKGDWLITFDSRALENELTQQTIMVKATETLVIQAKAAYDTAVITLRSIWKGRMSRSAKRSRTPSSWRKKR